MNEYRPRFKSEIYLKFLNSVDNHIEIKKDESDDSITLYLFTLLWREEQTLEVKCIGRTLEECLDQTIFATGFEKNL